MLKLESDSRTYEGRLPPLDRGDIQGKYEVLDATDVTSKHFMGIWMNLGIKQRKRTEMAVLSAPS